MWAVTRAAIVASGEKVAADLQVIVANVKAGRGTVGQLLNDDALYQRAKSIAADAEKAMANVREATDEARAAIADLRGKDGPVQGLTGDLQQTLTAARDAMSDLAENTEALKRNFLFRGYFNRRGYFDLDDISPEEYRRGALESPTGGRCGSGCGPTCCSSGHQGRRTAERGRQGAAELGDVDVCQIPEEPICRGRVRTGLTGDERFLLSRRRARLVRDYLVSRFDVGSEPDRHHAVGKHGRGSPTGDTWDGVGLAIFVPISAL